MRGQNLQQTRPQWLFGENRGQTIDNNSWHTYRRAVQRAGELGVESWFVLEPTAEHRRLVARLPRHLRRGIVWRGSRRHCQRFASADRFFITLSFQDIEPPQINGTSTRRVPLVHLQHGTIGIKTVGYHGTYYRNTIDAFCIYADEERGLLRAHNGFRDEQLLRMAYPPRYGALLHAQRTSPVHPGQVLWFLTWRDYLHHEAPTTPEERSTAEDAFVATIADTLTRAEILPPLRTGELRFDVCFHQFFPRVTVDRIRDSVAHRLAGDAAARGIRIQHANDVTLMKRMARAEMLVTDYSSLAYDMTFLGKSVGMYMFDLPEYIAHRPTYIDLRDVFTEHVAHEPGEFLGMLEAARGSTHPHFAARVRPPTGAAERAWIADGAHIDDLLNEMRRRDGGSAGAAAALRPLTVPAR